MASIARKVDAERFLASVESAKRCAHSPTVTFASAGST